MDSKKQTRLVVLITLMIVLVDQIVKIAVKLNMHLGEEYNLIGTWCRLHFTENPGFAFGTSFGGVLGKYLLTFFRIVAAGGIAWYIVQSIKKHRRTQLILSLTLIMAGAFGNIIDCCFYGLIFSDSYFHVATLFPEGGGYAPLLQGKVVDMFYFPMFQSNWPSWMPWIGGKHFEFFSAIFNLSDSSITIGAIWLLIDQIFFAPKQSKSDVREGVGNDK